MADSDPFIAMLEGLRDAGLTTTSIAREAGVSRQTLWRFTTGDSRQPSLESFNRLALVCRRHGLPIPGPSNRR
jgi:transcriptional regulator with XRE-family HTH domain